MARLLLYHWGAEYTDAEQLAKDLEAAGHKVTIKPRGPAMDTAGPVPELFFALTLKLLKSVEDHVLDALVAALLLRLRTLTKKSSRTGRTAAIVGPDGEVLREVELPDES